MDGFKFKDRVPPAFQLRGDNAKAPLKAGDRFFQTHSLRSVWIVEKVFIPRGIDLPHAILIRDGEQTDRRIISQGALLDPAFYHKDKRGRAVKAKDTDNLHRRCMDLPRGRVRPTVN